MRCLTSFCLLAMLAFCRKALPCLPSFPTENSRLLRQKPQKFAQFWRSKPFSSLPRHVFGVQKFFHCLHEAILGFKSVFVAPLVVFWASKELLLPTRSIFSLQKYFHCLPEAFSAFKSSFTPHPKRFWASKELLLLRSACFVARQSLAYDFLFARNARSFVSQRNALLTEFSCGKLALFFAKTTKIRAFYGKSTKIRAYSVRFHLSKAVSIRFRQKSSYSKEFLWLWLKLRNLSTMSA